MGSEWFEKHERNDRSMQKDNDEYNKFVDKFSGQHKKTSDDCYTPDNVYSVIKEWAIQHYNLAGAEIIRPFYPGGDYQKEVYPKNCVVIDNPPFSCLSDICRWYDSKKIQFFLFAPTLTLFGVGAGAFNYIPVGANVTFENGAKVNVSFVSDLGDYKIETAPDLYKAIDAENIKNEGAEKTLCRSTSTRHK